MHHVAGALTADSQPTIHVFATTFDGTRAALAAAVPLARGSSAKLVLIVPRIVPYPLELDAPCESTTFVVKQYAAAIERLGGNPTNHVRACRPPGAIRPAGGGVEGGGGWRGGPMVADAGRGSREWAGPAGRSRRFCSERHPLAAAPQSSRHCGCARGRAADVSRNSRAGAGTGARGFVWRL